MDKPHWAFLGGLSRGARTSGTRNQENEKSRKSEVRNIIKWGCEKREDKRKRQRIEAPLELKWIEDNEHKEQQAFCGDRIQSAKLL